MQVNQSQKQSKTKYVKPQVFSISGAIRPHNPAHCRSLVDLNNLQITSAQKQNHNTDHFSSVTSNQENKPFNNLKNNVLRTGNTKISTNDYANVSNISKIIMNGNNSKPKTPMESNKSGFLAHQNSVSTNKNKTILGQTRKNDLFFENSSNNKLTKNQARTNSQVNLRQNNGSIPKNSSKNLRQTQLQKQKSQKSLKKANPQPNSQINALGLNQTQNTKQMGQQSNNINKTDYSLLIKLKQYIQQLKTNENEYIKHIKQLQNEANLLKDEIVLLKDKVQVYQIREKQMMKKIKNQQFQINRYSHLQQDLNNNSNPKNNECQEHQLIIQSLKNVINEQMSKIIQMQSYKIQLQEQQEKQRKNKKGLQQLQFLQKDMYRQRSRENEGDHHYRDQKNNGFKLQNAFVQTGSKADNRFQEVYSFKKRNNLNESSIYIEDETPNSLQLQSNRALTNQEGSGKGAGSKGKNSQICIPEPYNQLIKCLKSDSRMRQNSKNNTSKNNIKSKAQQVEVVSIDSSRHNQLDFSRKSQQNLQDSDIISSNENSNNKEYLKFRGHCSEDQILQEVGQYLQNIRKNLRQV